MTKMKKKIRKTYRRNVKWMAAAALTAVLLSGQVMPAVAAGSSTVISVSSIIPENITIDSPVPLSEISLPKSEYGKLSWADDSLVPSRRSESFEVVFSPSESFDLSRIDGWDGESEKITGYVTVVVSNIQQSEPAEEAEYGEPEEDISENNEEVPSPEQQEEVSGEAEPVSGEIQDASDVSENSDEEADASPETTEDGTKNKETPDDMENPKTEDDQITEDGQKETEEVPDSSDNVEGSDDTETNSDAAEENGESGPAAAEKEEIKEEPAESEDKNAGESETADEQAGESGENKGAEEEAPSDADAEDSDSENQGQTEENPDNIFDRVDEEVKDERPVTAEEDLTEEEMQQRAEENHSCDGIYVSGINLPWYVQFRATSGESYEFTNESHASIFKSYEFELWDLKNNTEYEIPEGEYISVTIPVKEGYEYTIEHLLDNGATETIIPSVEGGTMVFSTHSFSPFGIAGSKPLVGGNVAENNYQTPTPTVAPTKTPAGTNSNPAGSSTTSNTNAGTTNNGGSNTTGNTNNSGSSGQPSKDNPGYVTNNSGQTAGTNNSSSGSSSSNSGETKNKNQDSNIASGQNSTSATAVKTGDNTQILPFVILVAAAVIIIAAVLVLKKKKS